MTRNMVIGRFRPSRQGGWEGEIHTLTIHRQIRLIPNDERGGTAAPAFHVMLGRQHIGDAWENESSSDPNRFYLRVRIDDPFCPLSAWLFPGQDMSSANLVVRPVRPDAPGAMSGEKRDG